MHAAALRASVLVFFAPSVTASSTDPSRSDPASPLSARSTSRLACTSESSPAGGKSAAVAAASSPLSLLPHPSAAPTVSAEFRELVTGDPAAPPAAFLARFAAESAAG